MGDIPKTFLTWDEVRQLAMYVADQIREDFEGTSTTLRCYPVPRGGVYAAMLVREALHSEDGIHMELVGSPENCDLVIDDLVDSGKTRDRILAMTPKAGCVRSCLYCLLDKQQERVQKWIVFPWETLTLPWEQSQKADGPTDAVVRILEFIGEDPRREGLLETPARVIKSYGEIFAGYAQNPMDHLKTFEEGACDEMVVLKDIEFYSVCEHHMQPFFGKAHIAYIPNKRVVGVSKLARILDTYARRLQIQEKLTTQITEALMEHLQPLGAACIIEAKHFCMVCRGVSKQNSTMITSSMKGVFLDKDNDARQELFGLIKG